MPSLGNDFISNSKPCHIFTLFMWSEVVYSSFYCYFLLQNELPAGAPSISNGEEDQTHMSRTFHRVRSFPPSETLTDFWKKINGWITCKNVSCTSLSSLIFSKSTQRLFIRCLANTIHSNYYSSNLYLTHFYFQHSSKNKKAKARSIHFSASLSLTLSLQLCFVIFLKHFTY